MEMLISIILTHGGVAKSLSSEMTGPLYNKVLALDSIAKSLLYKIRGQMYDYVWKVFEEDFCQASLIGSQGHTFDFRCKRLMAMKVVGLESIQRVS